MQQVPTDPLNVQCEPEIREDMTRKMSCVINSIVKTSIHCNHIVVITASYDVYIPDTEICDL